MYRVVFLSIILVSFSLVLFAQQPPTLREMEKEQQRAEQEMKKMQEEMKKRQEEELDMLKKMDPEGYKERVALYGRQEKINKIVSDFRTEKISEVSATKRLFPLVKENLKGTIDSLGNRIKQLKTQLDFLQKAKRNPNLLVEKQIKRMLGLQEPSPEDLMPF